MRGHGTHSLKNAATTENSLSIRAFELGGKESHVEAEPEFFGTARLHKHTALWQSWSPCTLV